MLFEGIVSTAALMRLYYESSCYDKFFKSGNLEYIYLTLSTSGLNYTPCPPVDPPLPMIEIHTGCHCIGHCIFYTVIPGLLGS